MGNLSGLIEGQFEKMVLRTRQFKILCILFDLLRRDQLHLYTLGLNQQIHLIITQIIDTTKSQTWNSLLQDLMASKNELRIKRMVRFFKYLTDLIIMVDNNSDTSSDVY
mmetsp:Transcript_8301/g.13877  ORF Transcript_8301/g.13877 Transcript_8301/m.13877 type:complete len:109 (-) Transcript_8301:2545-2871(-)